MFAAGLVIFSLASLLCGLAPDPTALNLARAVQGVGGALMFAVSLALIAQEFASGRERGMAMGMYGSTIGVAVAIGPLGEVGQPAAVRVDEAEDAAVPFPYLRMALLGKAPVQLAQRRLLEVRQQPGEGLPECGFGHGSHLFVRNPCKVTLRYGTVP